MTDMTTTTGGELTTEQMMAWGGASNLDSSDFRVSKILLMQGSSEMVKDRSHEAKIGDLRDNVTGQLIGTMDEGIDFIPFHLEKRWDVEGLIDGKWKWVRSELVTPHNSKRPISWSRNKFTEVHGERFFVMYRAFVLLASDLENGIEKPYIIDFKASSRETGRQLGQRMFQDNRLEKLPPAGYVATLKAEEISNDDNSWLALTVKSNTRKANSDEVMSAYKMSKLLNDMDTSHAEKPEEGPQKEHVSDDIPF